MNKKLIKLSIFAILFVIPIFASVEISLVNFNGDLTPGSSGTADIYYNSDEDIGGIQFDISGASFINGSGGAVTDAGYIISTSASTLLAFSFSGATISAGSGVLVSIEFDNIGDEVCIIEPVIATPGGSTINTVLVDNCYSGSNSIVGCMDVNACNFDAEATEPGDCTYPESGFDCDGNCVIGEDCEGVCGGSAEFDECSVCSGDNSSCADCSGIPNGNAEIDMCGVCDNDITNDCIQDCTGEWGGTSVIDDCGICNGNNDCLNENHYNVTIGNTGVSQLIILENTITELVIGDEIGVFDLNGILNDGDCETVQGELLVASGIWSGEQLEITAIGQIDVCDFGGVQRPGFVSGNSIEIRVWRDGEEIIPNIEYSFGDGEFGELLPDVISEITLCNGIVDECGICNGDNSTCADCVGIPFGNAELDCAGICNGSTVLDICEICGGDDSSCSGCMDIGANNYDVEAIFDDGTCEFPVIEIEEPEELTSYDSSVDIDIPEVILTDVSVDIDIPAGALDVPEGTEVTLEASEVSENELQDIIDNSSSSDAGVEVFEGISFEATDENGDPIELVDGATLDVTLSFTPERNEYDLGYITEDGEIVALGANCIDNGDGSWTCAGDGPGFGSYIVYSFDPVATISGCTLMSACNYNIDATMNDGSCEWPTGVYDCDGNCMNDSDSDLICDENEIMGCNDIGATDYNPNATEDDGSCSYLNGYSPYYGPRTDWVVTVSTQQGFVVIDDLTLNGSIIESGVENGTSTGGCPDGNCDILSAMYNGASVGWSYCTVIGGQITVAVNFKDANTPGLENYPQYVGGVFHPNVTFNFYDSSEEIVYYNVMSASPVIQGLENIGSIDITGDGPFQSCDGFQLGENNCFAQEPGCPLSYDLEFNPNAGISDCNNCSTFYSFCGCTDPTTPNYNPDALVNDGTCQYGFSFTHNLNFGNNLISFPGTLEDNSSQLLLEGLMNNGPEVVFLLGQGVGLFNTTDGWSGNLNYVNEFSGYWINAEDIGFAVESPYPWEIEFSSAIEACTDYSISFGNNLMSYRWGTGNSSTMDALGGVDFATENFNFILGQGVGLFNTNDGWSGNLNNLIEGKGYWLNIENSSIDFKWGFDNCASAPIGQNMVPQLNKQMVDEFKFIQSTEQAFYLIEDLKVDGNHPEFNDIVLAYNRDVLVGSAYWDGKHTAVPVMGKDFSNNTNGFCEAGDNVSFKLYSFATGKIVNLNGEIPKWGSLLVTEIEKLNGEINMGDPMSFNLGHAYPNPFNPSTVFSYEIPNEGKVQVSVHDVNGRMVDILTDGILKSGSHSIEWNGNSQPTGLYFIKVEYNQEIKTEKIMLVK